MIQQYICIFSLFWRIKLLACLPVHHGGKHYKWTLKKSPKCARLLLKYRLKGPGSTTVGYCFNGVTQHAVGLSVSWKAQSVINCAGSLGQGDSPAVHRTADFLVFVARQDTDSRYWYSNAICLSVRPFVTFYWNGFTYCRSFFTTR